MNTDEEKIGAIISILTHIAKLQSVATLANGIMGLFLCTFVHLDIISGWASVIYLITNGTMMTSFAIVHIVQPFPAEKFYNPFVFMLLFGIPPIVIGSYEASQNA